MEYLKNYPWAEVFNIKESHFKEWEAQKSPESFVFWVLKKDLMDSSSYSEWAKNHYNIPEIKKSFIENYSLSKEQWKRVKDLEEWKKDLVPLWEAEDTLYIACLELPENTKNYRFVLASTATLESAWRRVRSFEELRAVSFPYVDGEEDTPRTSFDEEEPQRREEETGIFMKEGENTLNQGTVISIARKDLTSGDPEACFNELDSYFLGMILLKVESDSFVLQAGKRINFEQNKKISCESKNFLEITKKGNIYNGFVINNEANQNFFKTIGWSAFPKYVISIPIKDASQKTTRIFLGVSQKPISNNDIKKIERTITLYFEEATINKIAA